MKANYGLISFLALTLIQNLGVLAIPAGEEPYAHLEEIKQSRVEQDKVSDITKKENLDAIVNTKQSVENAVKSLDNLEKLALDIEFTLNKARTHREDLHKKLKLLQDQFNENRFWKDKTDYEVSEIVNKLARFKREKVQEAYGYGNYLRAHAKIEDHKAKELESRKSLTENESKSAQEVAAKLKKLINLVNNHHG